MNKKKNLIIWFLVILLLILGTTFGIHIYSNSNSETDNIYQSLVDDGYKGTVSQWLILLIEENAIDGKSAYEQVTDSSYTGAYKEWLELYLNNIKFDDSETTKTQDSKSGYDFALENGFNGNEEEWKNCFVSNSSEKSEFELCVDKEFSGDRIDWLNSINGPNGNDNSLYEYANKNRIKKSKEKWIISLLDKSNNYCNKYESTYAVINSCGYNDSLSNWILYLLGDLSIEDQSVLIYSIAVENGYKNTYQEWLKSLVQSSDENDSLYDKLVADGYVGTKQDLLDDISSSKDVDELYKKLKDKGYKGNKEEIIESISKKDSDSTDSTDEDITVSDSTVSQGDETTIVVSLKNNPGILGIKLSVKYDESALVLKSAENGDAFNSILTLTKPKNYYSGCNFCWDGLSLPNDEIKDGSMLILTFKTKESAKRGTYPIEISYKNGDIVDKNLKTVNPNISSGSIQVIK